jgi:hypothetical protein
VGAVLLLNLLQASAAEDLRCELAVIGGGSGGFGATLAAARRGVDVVLVERADRLGGNSVNGGVNIWEPGVGGTGIPFELYQKLRGQTNAVGIYSMGRHQSWFDPKREPYKFPGGETVIDSARTYLDTLQRHGVEKRSIHGVVFEPEAMAQAMRALLAETGHCRVLLNTAFTGAQVEGGRVKTVTLSSGAKLTADWFVDATGDGAVCAAAGCTLMSGQEARTTFNEPSAPEQATPRLNGVTLIYRVTPVATAVIEPLPANVAAKCWWSQRFPSAQINHYPNGDLNVNMLPTMDGAEFIKRGYADALAECQRRIRAHWHDVQTRCAEFQKYRISWVAPALGIRESQRVMGEYVLAESDLRAGNSGQKHPDIVCLVDHPMDTHGGHGRGIGELREPYGVPYRCLIPKGRSNLLIACRAASFSSLAASSCRLSRTMMELGEAAGTAVVLAKELKVELPAIPPERLRDALRSQHVQLDFPLTAELRAHLRPGEKMTLQARDDTPHLRVLLAAGGRIRIPPGDYQVGNGAPLPLLSGMQVEAQGARFHLPETLGDKARVVVFAGTNITDFAWHGGEFIGHVFDPARRENTWEPNANTRAIVITTTPGGTTSNILFREVRSRDLAGAVINVTGALPPHGEREVLTYASDVRLENCTLLRSGKFMWDYGYLWQQIVWPEDYAPWEVERARRYFRTDLIRSALQMDDGDDCVRFDNRTKPIKVSPTNQPHYALCFFGDVLPRNIVRGKQYFVVATAPDHIKVADRLGGMPIRFTGTSGSDTKLIYNLQAAGPSLYAPTGAGPGKGAVDVVGCRNVSITGCTLSALGDTMHLQRSQDAIFSHNHITGSRMGAFFIAEFCQRVVAASNTVDGSNGSRVMSVEKSATDVQIIGNTFFGGGRGSWINQPHNLLIQGNVFSNNTTKCEHDPRRGRRSFATGDWEQYAEMYFTTYETGGRYDNVVVRDNLFVTGPEAAHALTFAAGGSSLVVTNNVFRGSVRTLPTPSGCTNVVLTANAGLELMR